MLMVSESHNVYENLALEEHLMGVWERPEPLVMLYRNSPAVVVGAHQNTHREANTGELGRRGLVLARRVSGGGTVYHDLGNVCFSIMVAGQDTSRIHLPTHLQPVVQALQVLGIPAEASPRNDILLAGKKITGTASRMKRDRLLFHGTLLYDADLDSLHGVLQPSPGLIRAKGAPSVKSAVANIRFSHDLGGVAAFMEKLGVALCPGEVATAPPADALAAAQVLVQEKYTGWPWLYGRNPACDFAMLLTEPESAPRPVLLGLKGDEVLTVSDASLEFLVGTPFVEAELEKQLAPRGLALRPDEAARLEV